MNQRLLDCRRAGTLSSRQFSGPCRPHKCFALYPSSSGEPVKVLSTVSEMSLLNPDQNNKKKPHPHVRWEPVEIPTKKELGGQQ